MKVYLYNFTSSINDIYFTNDNYSHVVAGITYSPIAIESKEVIFDLKEIVGEVSINLPWSTAGFLKDHLATPFDAPVRIDMWALETTSGMTVPVFVGFVNSYHLNQNTLELGCLSFVEQARDNFPRMVVTRYCNLQLFSSLCGVTVGDYTDDCNILSVGDQRLSFTVSGITHSYLAGENWFQYGFVTKDDSYRFITASAFQYFQVGGATVDGHFLDVMHPIPESWVVGTTVQVSAGCDKTMETCKMKYNNFVHFLGFPHAPYETIRLTGLRSSEIQMGGGGKK